MPFLHFRAPASSLCVARMAPSPNKAPNIIQPWQSARALIHDPRSNASLNSVGGIITEPKLGETFVNVRQWSLLPPVHPGTSSFLVGHLWHAAAPPHRSAAFEKGSTVKGRSPPWPLPDLATISANHPNVHGSFVQGSFTPLTPGICGGFFHGRTGSEGQARNQTSLVITSALRETVGQFDRSIVLRLKDQRCDPVPSPSIHHGRVLPYCALALALLACAARARRSIFPPPGRGLRSAARRVPTTAQVFSLGAPPPGCSPRIFGSYASVKLSPLSRQQALESVQVERWRMVCDLAPANLLG